MLFLCLVSGVDGGPTLNNMNQGIVFDGRTATWSVYTAVQSQKAVSAHFTSK